jgi:hypothetical protein
MKLDFAALVQSDAAQPARESWGQAGTAGTPATARLAACPGLGDRPGTGGDKSRAGAANDGLAAGGGDLVPAICPQVSPLRPHPTEARNPNEINASPVSPIVPSVLTQGAIDDDDEREAFEERAAIMEFDGGMTRSEAEAAARAVLGLAS